MQVVGANAQGRETVGEVVTESDQQYFFIQSTSQKYLKISCSNLPSAKGSLWPLGKRSCWESQTEQSSQFFTHLLRTPECYLNKVLFASLCYSGLTVPPPPLVMIPSADCLQKQEWQSAFYTGMNQYINGTMLSITSRSLCKEFELFCSLRLDYGFSGIKMYLLQYIYAFYSSRCSSLVAYTWTD